MDTLEVPQFWFKIQIFCFPYSSNSRIILSITKKNHVLMSNHCVRQPLRPELDGQDQVQIIVTRALNWSH
jgi:hypothetical protein